MGVGTFNLTVSVSDGLLSDSKQFTITLTGPPEGATTSLSGQAPNTVTTAPLENVRITVGDVTGPTNANGEFFLDNLEGGKEKQKGASTVGRRQGWLGIDYSLPSFMYLNQREKLTFTYNSDAVCPKPVITLDVNNRIGGALPDFICTTVNVAGVKQPPIYSDGSEMKFGNTEKFRQAVQFNAKEFHTCG